MPGMNYKCALCGVNAVGERGFVCDACRLWMQGRSPSEEIHAGNDEVRIYAEATKRSA